jgi:predicted PurR-regulated permease PerM
LVLVAVLLGAQLLGILGALIAIPVAAMIKILIQDWWAHRTPRSPRPAGDDPPVPPERPAPT